MAVNEREQGLPAGAHAIGIGDFSGAGVTTDFTDDEDNGGQHRGLHLILNVTAIGSALLTPHIQGIGPYGSAYDLLAGAQISANGLYVYRVFPGANPVAGLVANDTLTDVFRIWISHANANLAKYTVGLNLLP